MQSFGADMISPKIEATSARGAMAKLDAKLERLITDAKLILVLYAGPAWDTVKESKFTPVLQKFNSFCNEAGTLGDKKTLDVAKKWVERLSAGKLLMQFLREWARSHHKHHKFLECADSMFIFKNSLTDEGINAAGTFMRMFMKLRFFVVAAPAPIQISAGDDAPALKSEGLGAEALQAPSCPSISKGIQEIWDQGCLELLRSSSEWVMKNMATSTEESAPVAASSATDWSVLAW